MGHRTLDQRCAVALRVRLMFAFVVALATIQLHGQVVDKKHSIFDDDAPSTPTGATPSPATPGTTAPGPANVQPPVAPPTPGAAAGLIATLHGGETTDAKPREYHLTPNLGISFLFPATGNGYVPMAFSWRGLINIPAGGAQGAFVLKCIGESDLMVDGQVVSAVHPGDAAASFERPQNLAAGIHTLNATAFHLQSTGMRQRIQLWFRPTTGEEFRVPATWFWHLRADEPADLTEIKPAGPGGQTPSDGPAPTNDPRRGWVAAGTPRPDDPTAHPTDLLPGVVTESYFGASFGQFKEFQTLDRPRMDLTVNPNPNGIQPAQPGTASVVTVSFKWRGMFKIDANSQCRFAMNVAPARVRVLIDNQIITATGFANEAPVQTVANLGPGLHAIQVELSRIGLAPGRYGVNLQWEVNGQALSEMPTGMFFHYRSQEPWPATPIANSGTSGPAPAAVAKVRKIAIPDPIAQSTSTAQLQQRYSADWTAAASAQSADRWMKAAEENRGDAVAVFVLLQKAYQQAVAASAIDLAFAAIDLLSSQFSVDGVGMKLAVLKSSNSKPTVAADLATVTAVFQQAISEDNFPAAADAAALSLTQAKALNIPAEVEAANQRVRIAAAANAEFASVQPMIARLANNANDADANLAAGKFYCFTARNWTRGAPLLAHCADPTLSWLGAHESIASDPASQVAVANGWWETASAQNEPVASAMRARAAEWYRIALPNLSGLSRRVAERRSARPATTTSAPDSRGAGGGKL